jgi:hypothetical protein
LNIETFKQEYQDKTDEALDTQTLRKLELVKTMNETEYPTNVTPVFSLLKQSLVIADAKTDAFFNLQ